MRRAALTGLLLTAACARHRAPLLDPAAAPRQPAPAVFRVRFETTRGPFVIQARRAWAPAGADRLYHLARHGFYDGVRFFRVVDGFMAQFGISGDPRVSAVWRGRTIGDDPVTQSNRRGTVTFATSGPNTRTTQLFVNYRDNPSLDTQGFAPVGEVVSGMDVVENLWRSYGDAPPRGNGPDQERIYEEGERYLSCAFPRLDRIVRARVVADPSASPPR